MDSQLPFGDSQKLGFKTYTRREASVVICDVLCSNSGWERPVLGVLELLHIQSNVLALFA